MPQPAVQEHHIPVCTPSHAINESSEMGHGCHVLPGEINTHYCHGTKADHPPSFDHPIRDHMGRMPLHMNTATIPPNLIQYPRSPYCNQRKRPRFGNQSGAPSGGCGCGRGEILESSDPVTFKVHYRTEQRVFVTVQFGKRMYLGELFAEDLE